MRGTRAKMIRKHLRPLFSKEEPKVKSFSPTFRYSRNSFQRHYKNAKRAVV